MIAGLDACTRIFIDKKLSGMFMELKNHILKTKPWYIVDNQDNNKSSIYNNLLKFINQIKKKLKILNLNTEIKGLKVIFLRGRFFQIKLEFISTI